MRERDYVLHREVCDGAFIDGVETEAELSLRGSTEPCRFYGNDKCPVVNGMGLGCVALDGQEVARNVLRDGTSIDDEIADYAAHIPMPARGFFDPTIEEPGQGIRDRQQLAGKVKPWVKKILGVEDADADSLNHEYTRMPSERNARKYPVLSESLYDEESRVWLHSCGTRLAVGEVRNSVWFRSGPGPCAGSGEVRIEERPYCPACQEKPPTSGIVYQEDLDREEIGLLRNIANS